MNEYLQKSIELANHEDYLDRLHSVYPITINEEREVDSSLLSKLERAFIDRNDRELILLALKLDLFPIKDSYVAFLNKCPSSMIQNPDTVKRIAGVIYDIGWENCVKNITQPKENNRQMGSKFTEWLQTSPFGIKPVYLQEFVCTDNDAILESSDKAKKDFAMNAFGYSRDKGLDFIARFNKKYIIGEAKFLTDYGGHQVAQFEDALSTLNTEVHDATCVAILDGVVFIKGKNKMYNRLTTDCKNKNILSSLLLIDFCYSI